MRLGPYSSYRNYNSDWLSCLPTDWKRLRLKFLTRFMVSGGTPSTSTDAFWGGEIPWVSPKDMKAAIITETQDYLTEDGLAFSSARLIPADTLLMVVRSGILRHSIPVALSGLKVAINQDIKALGFEPVMNSAFVRYFIEGLQSQLLNRWSKIGCTVESIETEDFANDLFPVPPVEHQDSIVAFLDRETARIDALLAKKRRLLELLEEKRVAVITNAVTKGLDPKVAMKDSGIEWLGQIPAHWDVLPLGYRYSVQLGKMLDGRKFTGTSSSPYLRNVDVQWGRINLTDLPEMDFDQRDRELFALRPVRAYSRRSRQQTGSPP